MLSSTHQPSSTWGSHSWWQCRAQTCIPNAGARQPSAPAHAAPMGAAGGERARAARPAAAFFQPCPYHHPCTREPKSLTTSTHINRYSEGSLICPAGYPLWDVPQPHCTHQVQSQICHFPPNSPLLHLHLGSTACLVTEARLLGVRLDTHSTPTTSQSPVPLVPPSQLPSGFSIFHLVKKWLLGTSSLAGTNC